MDDFFNLHFLYERNYIKNADRTFTEELDTKLIITLVSIHGISLEMPLYPVNEGSLNS